MELTGYLAVARRWWWTLLVATWVAGVSGYVVASQIPPTYEAETQLLVGPFNTDRETLVASGDLVQTYPQLVTTTPLLQSAITEAGAQLTPADLSLATRVTANDTTRFLSIRVQDTSPVMAATLANKLAEELTQLASAGTNRPEGQVQIVDAAVPPTDPVAPQKSLIVGLAALAALIGAMVLVMLLEYLSAAVRSEDELGRLSGLPFLGRLDISRSLPGERGLIDQAPDSAAAAAYRLVLAKAAFREAGGPARSIVVVGTGSDGASSQIAANLAAITARSGRQVALVDYDSSDWSVTRIFGLYDRSGVTDLIDASPDDVSSRLVRVSSTMRVLPHGISKMEPDTIDPDRGWGHRRSGRRGRPRDDQRRRPAPVGRGTRLGPGRRCGDPGRGPRSGTARRRRVRGREPAPRQRRGRGDGAGGTEARHPPRPRSSRDAGATPTQAPRDTA